MSGDLDGRVAIVTGASRNIGRAIALRLAADGAAVVVNARSSAEEAAAGVREIDAAGGRAIVHLADVADPDGAAGLVEAAAARFGGLDILVNNAAVRRETAFEDLKPAEWREVMSIILDGAYLTVRAAAPRLRRSEAGAIVNIGGLSAHTGSRNRAHVIAAKAGLVGLTRALACDLGEDGVTVNCVSPGLIDTPRKGPQKPAHHGGHDMLLGRRGRPEEVAGLVSYLCGPDARYVTGQVIHANGGAFLG